MWEFPRLSFIRTVLSKRKLAKLVDKGIVRGWNDPRMPTIRGILRRGMAVPALREFLRTQGPSRNIVALDWSTLWARNKKYIDPAAPRHTAIENKDMVTVTVQGANEVQVKEKPKHIKNPTLGLKKVVYSNTIIIDQEDACRFTLGEEITLMNWGNALVRDIHTDQSDKKVASLILELHLQGNFKTTDKKITWLSKEEHNLIPVKLFDFDHLIVKDKLEKEDNITEYLTPRTETQTEAWADCNVSELNENDIIQFERKGYFRVDMPFRDGNPAIFFKIPTGKES
jgi:glutamyl-tRNA synthetase